LEFFCSLSDLSVSISKKNRKAPFRSIPCRAVKASLGWASFPLLYCTVLNRNSSLTINNNGATADFCVCRSDQPTAVLQKAIDFACGPQGGADCTAILQGGGCYNPNTVATHCSWAANSYYQNNKARGATCDFGGAATVSTTDPSTLRRLSCFALLICSVLFCSVQQQLCIILNRFLMALTAAHLSILKHFLSMLCCRFLRLHIRVQCHQVHFLLCCAASSLENLYYVFNKHKLRLLCPHNRVVKLQEYIEPPRKSPN
jgi:hypothetical protein